MAIIKSEKELSDRTTKKYLKIATFINELLCVLWEASESK